MNFPTFSLLLPVLFSGLLAADIQSISPEGEADAHALRREDGVDLLRTLPSRRPEGAHGHGDDGVGAAPAVAAESKNCYSGEAGLARTATA